MTRFIKQSNLYLNLGLIFLSFLLIAVFFGEWIDPYDKDESIPAYTDEITGKVYTAPFPPSVKHIFGTDNRGIDLFSQLLRGAKYTILVVTVVALSRLLLAVPLGMIAGYWPKYVKTPLSYINRVWNAVPMFIIVYFLMQPIVLKNLLDMKGQMIAFWIILTLAGFPPLVETIRGHVERIKSMDFMESVKILGGGPFYTMRKHILPHLAPHLIIILSLEFAQILWLLGQLGIFNVFVGGMIERYVFELNTTFYYSESEEWAGLLGGSRRFILTAPWLAIGPGIAFFFGIFTFSLLAEGMKKWMDKNRLKFDFE